MALPYDVGFAGFGGLVVVMAIVLGYCFTCRLEQKSRNRHQNGGGSDEVQTHEPTEEVRAVATAGNVVTDAHGNVRIQFQVRHTEANTNMRSAPGGRSADIDASALLRGRHRLVTGVVSSGGTCEGEVVFGDAEPNGGDTGLREEDLTEYGEAVYGVNEESSPTDTFSAPEEK